MPKTSYPGGVDLERFLLGSGLYLQESPFTLIDLPTRIGSGIKRFEERAGRKMLATADTSRTMNPPVYPGTILGLSADLAAITSLTIGGVAKTKDVDYFLGPENADLDGKPFSWIELATPTSAGRKSVVIVGKWAFGTAMPDDAWEGMLAYGAHKCGPELAGAISRGLVSWKGEAGEENYGADPLGKLLDRWEKQGSCAADDYLRVTVGV